MIRSTISARTGFSFKAFGLFRYTRDQEVLVEALSASLAESRSVHAPHKLQNCLHLSHPITSLLRFFHCTAAESRRLKFSIGRHQENVQAALPLLRVGNIKFCNSEHCDDSRAIIEEKRFGKSMQ